MNLKTLHSKVKHWWLSWANENGEVGDMYNYMMRSYKSYRQKRFIKSNNFIKLTKKVEEIDQFKNLVDGLINDPHSRRHVITLWNPDLKNMALANCHGTHIQFYVEDGKLSMDTHQRSMDFMLGGFVNFTSYAILLHIVAKLTGYKPYILNYNIGDLHIYNNHIEGAKELLTRDPIECERQLVIDQKLTFENLMYNTKLTGEDLDKDIDRIVDMFKLKDYVNHPAIKLDIAV